MKMIKERLTQLDNEEFVHDLFNDSNNINGNKCHTFRLFKISVETANESFSFFKKFVSQNFI
jgi:hypothetical protein